MCSLFGIVDYKNALTCRQKNKMLSVLSRECEVRGTDATGIAYNYNGSLRIYKRPLAARRMKFRVPNGVNVIMGHTRMATQGDAKHNYNNHPWLGQVQQASFSLAHNGVLWNDDALRPTLPKTKVQTDSYVALQLLEQQNTLDFDSLTHMAETVEGSFVFTVLDNAENLFVVVGNNPFVLYHYDGFNIYASTDEILEKAISRLRIGEPAEILEPKEGDILKIDRSGKITYGSFQPKRTYPHWWRSTPYYASCLFDDLGIELDDLIDVAKSMGYAADEIMVLLDFGCSISEIEEMLYDPALLHETANELLYAY